MTKARIVLGFCLSLGLAACAPAEESPESISEDAAPTSEPMTTEAVAFLDPNTASLDQLAVVPGLDSEAAEALVAGRPYANMVEVNAALPDDLSEEARDGVFSHVWMAIDLNGAGEEEIMLIPGVGSRMAHEFEEYRPYDVIERFRREIGKYVDSTEVARLEQYVEIR